MGQSAAETVREIEQTRARLSDELDELEDRLPDAAIVAKKAARIAAGGGVAGTAVMFIARRAMRKRKQKKEMERLRVEPMQIKLDLMPERVGELLADRRATQWMAGAAGMWLFLRLAELRSLRKLRRQAMQG